MTEKTAISKLAEQVLQDPILLGKLSDRVSEIMIEEIRNQSDRLGLSRRLF
jgi:hypothetical protein